MAEGDFGPELGMTGPPPEFLGSAFRTGRYGGRIESAWKDVVSYYDVKDDGQRMLWCFENMRVFSDGTFPSPAEAWRGVGQHLTSDLKLAGTRGLANESVSNKERLKKSLEETEKDYKAMMAVAAAARCMERSGGSAKDYVDLISSKEGIGAQSTQAEFILHDDPAKLNRVINNPLVRKYYDRLLAYAGITSVKEWEIEETTNSEGKLKTKKIVSDFEVDTTEAQKGKLAEYLKDKARKGGFNGFIADVLLGDEATEDILELMENNVEDTARWSAARLACDAFMADKYTRWVYEVDEDDDLSMQPTINWGGDPFRATLEPSFLPRRVKKVYRDSNSLILDLVDGAIRPNDIFNKGDLAPNLVQPTAVSNLSRFARINDALWQLIGGSRAEALASWNDKTLGESLPQIVELIDQVYGDTKSETEGLKTDSQYPVGKHIVGVMMARLLEAKALALTSESAKPNFSNTIKQIFTKPEEHPFRKVLQTLWGPNLDAQMGFLKGLAGERTRFVLDENNLFDAEAHLKETWELLYTNDQSEDRMQRAKFVATARTALEVSDALSKIWTQH